MKNKILNVNIKEDKEGKIKSITYTFDTGVTITDRIFTAKKETFCRLCKKSIKKEEVLISWVKEYNDYNKDKIKSKGYCLKCVFKDYKDNFGYGNKELKEYFDRVMEENKIQLIINEI